MHLEHWGRREDDLLRLLREEAPDLIVLTGDYLNLSYREDPEAHAQARELLKAISGEGDRDFPAPPAGVYAVLGSPAVDRNSASLFDGLAVHLLRDEMVEVDLGKGRSLIVLGVECNHRPRIDAPKLAALIREVPEDVPRVLLYHSPELMPFAEPMGIDLYLCGHTHGGQVRLPLYGAIVTASHLGKRFEMGHYQRGNTHLYVSRGVGFEGHGAPRVRFLCRPEITTVRLGCQ